VVADALGQAGSRTDPHAADLGFRADNRSGPLAGWKATGVRFGPQR